MALFNFFTKGVKTQIKELESFITIVKTSGSGKKYYEIRAEFNLRVLNALAGMGFKENEDKTYSSTGWTPLPSRDEVFTIRRMIIDFITNIEPRLKVEAAEIEDEMKVVNPNKKDVHYIADINNEKFKEMVISNLTEELLEVDFLTIADMGGQLRKRNVKKAAYWAAGITLTLAAGAGVYMYKKRQTGEKEKTVEVLETADYNNINDVVITVDDDTPVVIISDDDAEITIVD